MEGRKIMNNNRKCYKCGNIKPLTPEFFARAGKRGFDQMCKICKKQYNEQHYATHPKPKIIQYTVGKFCVRYAAKRDVWTVAIKDPWKKIDTFKTLEKAKEWIKNLN
jgi:hypothetical protein